MIDIHEMCIGAHVEFNGKRAEILGIDVDDDEYAPIIVKTSLASVEPDEIDPIPITAELLQELGFECIERRGLVSIWQRGDISIYFVGKRIGMKLKTIKNDLNIASFRYLHELEAFVYLTTKAELIKED